MGVGSRILRFFCCEVPDDELYTPNEKNHKPIASRHNPANDVPSVSSFSSEECADTISSELTSPNCIICDGDSRTTELLYDPHYGRTSYASSSSNNCLRNELQYDPHYSVGRTSYALSSTDCLENDEDPRDSELLYDLHYGVDTSSHAFSPVAMDFQEHGNYYTGTSDALQQNELSSQSSFLWHNDCNMKQFALTLSRSSSTNSIEAETSTDSIEFEEQKKQNSHLLSDSEGGDYNESANSLGEIGADVIKKEVVEERWMKHYSSCQRILVVGDGDFSFSASLAKAFLCASNMIATSLDSREFLRQNYRRAITNIRDLERRGCRVIHGMDCTKMAKNVLLEGLTFDRIVYNFPFAGFFKDISRDAQLCLHKNLVIKFMENAKKMISKKGEIHITHKCNGFHREWNLENLAVFQGLRLIKAVNFNHIEYPGYKTKTGFGGDNNFHSNPSKTYMFALTNW